MLRSNIDGIDLYPGLEVLCSVEVDLEDAFNAAPIIIGKDGRKYRDVPVSSLVPPSGSPF
jgi:hypothetical protein